MNSYLGGVFAGGSPANPFGGFNLQPGTDGFDVFTIDVGNTGGNLPGPSVAFSSAYQDLFQFNGDVPVGTYIVADLVTSCTSGPVDKPCNNGVVNTALSGALLDPGTLSEVPLPGALWLFGSALAGLGMLSRRRKAKAQSVAA